MRIQDMKKSIVKLIAASLIVSAAFGTASCGTHPAEPAEVNTKTESEILSAVEGEVHVAADGSDEAGSGTVDAPFATISYAAETMPGSQIIVHEGEYMPFELGQECSGSEGSPTVIRAAEGERVVISAENTDSEERENATVNAAEGETASDEEVDRIGISILNVRHISVEGLEIRGGTHGIRYMSTREAGEQPLMDISIKNCTVHGVRGIHGINVYAFNDKAPVADLTIEGCEVYDCECGSSESLVLNGNIDGFLIAENTVHDNNNIGIDMIGFEGLAMHPEEDSSRNPYDADQVRNGICRDNVIYNISTEGNPAYFEDGEYDLCAGGIYVDGGRDIEICDNFIYRCDIGVEVATEHSPDDNELFRVTGIRVHDNVIADCTGWTGICFGGYDRDLGFTEDCEFDHNTLVDNEVQIGVQRSRNNRIYANMIIGGETGVEFNEDCSKEDMVNDISGNVSAEIGDEESWSEEYGSSYGDREEIADGFRSLIEDMGSRFVPDEEMMELYRR